MRHLTSSLLVMALFGAGCALDLNPDMRQVVAKLDQSLGVACHDGDTIQLRAKNGDRVIDEVAVPCSAGEAQLELGSSASIEARLLAARGAPGLDDDIVVGEAGGSSANDPDTYYIHVNQGFVTLRIDLLQAGSPTSCGVAGVASLRLELEDLESASAPAMTMFRCDQAEMISAPVRSSRSYTIRTVALDAQGATLGEGLGAVSIPHGNAYVDAKVDVIVD